MKARSKPMQTIIHTQYSNFVSIYTYILGKSQTNIRIFKDDKNTTTLFINFCIKS